MQQQVQNRANYLTTIQFKLMNTQKIKTYVVNTNWSMEEFMEYIKHQIYLDSDYYGIDIEKQQEIDFIPYSSTTYFDFTLFRLNKSSYYNDYGKYQPIKPSPQLFKYYFHQRYPSFTICTK